MRLPLSAWAVQKSDDVRVWSPEGSERHREVGQTHIIDLKLLDQHREL